MNKNWQKSFQYMLQSEGGYADLSHLGDTGGMTNLGVTRAVWENWVGHSVGEKEMRSLTPEKVEPLYKRKFWDACRCDDLPSGVDFIVFDMAVNAGVGRSAKILQKVVGTVPDGAIGPLTLAAVQAMNPEVVIDEFSKARAAFYRSLPTFGAFGNGWLNRVEHSKSKALAMA